MDSTTADLRYLTADHLSTADGGSMAPQLLAVPT